MNSNNKHPFRFCPVCGGELWVKGLDHGVRLVCAACGFIFYQNSKPTASAIITNGAGQVLLAKRAREPRLGFWDLPGGFLEDGEDPQAGVRREIREELGIDIDIIKIIGIYIDSYGHGSTVHTLNIDYACTVRSGLLRPMDDVAEVRWFSPDAIPWDRLAFRHLAIGLRDWIG
ncbi:MAG: NUDIX hydrolase [Patescibacteria group bacterium]